MKDNQFIYNFPYDQELIMDLVFRMGRCCIVVQSLSV